MLRKCEDKPEHFPVYFWYNIIVKGEMEFVASNSFLHAGVELAQFLHILLKPDTTLWFPRFPSGLEDIMFQWRRVASLPFFMSVIALCLILTGSMVLAAEATDLIPLAASNGETKVSVESASKSANGMTLNFQAPYLELGSKSQNGQKYHLIDMPGAESDGLEGQPALPLITRLVAIPNGQTLQLKNLQTQDTVVDGPFLPWPTQGLKDQADNSLSKDMAVYSGNKQVTSLPMVEVGEPGLLRGVRVVPVRFRPAVWNSADGKLTVAAEISAEFEFVASNDKNVSNSGSLIPESFATLYENEVIGYQRNGQVMQGPGTYLIIYPSSSTVLNNIQPLIDWRSRQGYNVVVASTSETGNTTSSIRNYLQIQYNNLSIPLEFVTLVGDANGSVSIPTFIENQSGYGGEGDHSYTLLEGRDILSDVHLGRLSVESTSQLADVVSKIVKYESDPYLDSDTGWFARAALAGDPASSGYSCIWINQWVKQQLLEHHYTSVDTIWNGNFSSQMMSSINSGISFFTYRGYWGMSGMSSGHIGSLYNGEKLPFALVVTCDTGSFETDGNCRSEAFLRNANGGGIGSIGTATIGTHTRYNNCVFQGVAESMINSDDSRAGVGLTAGKLHMYSNYYDREPSQVEVWCTWNNLMGDPATALWSGLPRSVSVDYANTITSGANSLPVVVSDGGPKEGALVTLYRKDVIQVSAVTDAFGRVNLPLTGLTDGTYEMTVTGRNIRPYLGVLNVGDLPASVNFASMTQDDDNSGDSQGNNDGDINPGETVELDISLINDGTGGVNNVTANLSSSHPQVTVVQADAAFGSIGSGVTTDGQQNYVVEVDPSAMGGSIISLDLVSTAGSDEWTSLVDLSIFGPAAEVEGYVLSGGSINPGESAFLEVDLRNTGNLPTSGATATLSSNSTWLSVTDSDGSYGPITVGSRGSNDLNTFTLNAGVECYPGHTATLTMDLVFDEGGTVSLPVLVTVGTASTSDPVGPDNHGYYAFDNTDTEYALAPTYDWVEIAPHSGGPGTSLGLQDNGRWQDDVVIVDLPFPFTYYGQTFTKMSVCSNGWISMGGTDLRHYRNWTLPSPGTPDNLIAVYWDDLYEQSSNSGIFSWYDEANHRLVIQWDNVANAVNSSAKETFEVILQDPAFDAGDTGDGIITMNYQEVNHTDGETGYATVGIQNEDRDDAVLYTYYQLYPNGAASLVDGRSIIFRTVLPQAQGILRGSVTNVADNGPIDGASVNILGTGLSLMSTENGLYQSGVTVGTYNVAVHHPSFAPDTTFGVVINEDMETVVDFALVDNAGPVFDMQQQPESTGDTAGPYDVVYEVSDYSGIQETHFYYTSSSTGGPFELTPQAEGPEDTWRVSIPGQADGTLIQYWMTSTDLVAFNTMEPASAPYTPYSFMIADTAILYTAEMENASDWTGGISGDNASSGLWTNVDPVGVFNGQTEVSPEDDHSNPGTMCWITGQDPVGGEQGANDIDGGVTTLQSPLFDIAGYDGLEVQYYRWYTNDTGYSPGEDTWVVQALSQSGAWVELESTSASNRSWEKMSFILADNMDLGNNTQFRFVASDYGQGSVVEAGVDDFMLTSFPQLTDSESPVVSLNTPNGGETLAMGSETDITWNQSDDIGVVNVQILLSTNNGSSFDETVAEGAFNGTYSWTVPSTPGSDNLIKVIVHDSAGNSTESVSAASFTIGGTSGVNDVPGSQLMLAQNSPNPFNPRTEIKFALPSAQNVTLRIYNVEGRLVRTLIQGRQTAGTHTIAWSGKNDQDGRVASGLYFYRLITDSGTLTRKMTLLK